MMGAGGVDNRHKFIVQPWLSVSLLTCVSRSGYDQLLCRRQGIKGAIIGPDDSEHGLSRLNDDSYPIIWGWDSGEIMSSEGEVKLESCVPLRIGIFVITKV